MKVFTTPHDLTECVLQCIAETARLMQISARQLVSNAKVVRLSTTVGTNALIQRTGPKLGVLVAAGQENNLYGTGALLQGEEPVVTREMVAGLECFNQTEEFDEAGVLAQVQQLVQDGARTLVVSGRNEADIKQSESRIRGLIKHHYPQHYLRYVPVQISTDISDIPDDEKRTNTAVINAYLHQDMARTLYRIEDRLRELGIRCPLQIVHANGGTARVAKTLAISTYSSGPVAGVVGLMQLAKDYGLKNAIATDMGGTSLDVGILADGKVPMNLEPYIDNIQISYPMIQVSSIGSGGGSIARVHGGRLQVGPHSAGSLPGPVCYDRGGDQPTVTDADVVLGYIDPKHFLGGRIPLNREKACRVIEEQIALPLNISMSEAALAIRAKLADQIGTHLKDRLLSQGIDPSETTLFAYGGAGSAHCCDYADAAAISRVMTFPFGSVCNAFGASTMDIAHTYLRSLPQDAALDTRLSFAHEAAMELMERAMLDANSEMQSTEEVYVQLGLFIKEEDYSLQITEPEFLFPSDGSEQELMVKALDRLFGRAAEQKVRALTLAVRLPIPHWQMPTYPLSEKDPIQALKGERKVFWRDSENGHALQMDTPVYDFELLSAGNVIKAPAIVEFHDTVCAVPLGWVYRLDERKMGWLEKDSAGR